jgi:hypothetical protein
MTATEAPSLPETKVIEDPKKPSVYAWLARIVSPVLYCATASELETTATKKSKQAAENRYMFGNMLRID